MGFYVKSLFGKLLFFVCIFRNDYGHFYIVHIIKAGSNFIALFFCGSAISVLYKLLFFFFPVMLNFVVHFYSSKLINRNNHSFSKKTTTREMMCNILSNFIKAFISFKNFNYLAA